MGGGRVVEGWFHVPPGNLFAVLVSDGGVMVVRAQWSDDVFYRGIVQSR